MPSAPVTKGRYGAIKNKKPAGFPAGFCVNSKVSVVRYAQTPAGPFRER